VEHENSAFRIHSALSIEGTRRNVGYSEHVEIVTNLISRLKEQLKFVRGEYEGFRLAVKSVFPGALKQGIPRKGTTGRTDCAGNQLPTLIAGVKKPLRHNV